MTPEALDYVEKQADKNMDFHLKNIDALNKEAHTTLALLLIAIPAAFTWAMKWFQQPGMMTFTIAMAGVCIYLIALALYLSRSVNPRDILAPGNEARPLMNTLISVRETHQKNHHWTWPKNWDLLSVREGELLNLQLRIEANTQRERETAIIVRRSRKLFIVAPLVFGAVAMFAAILRSACSLGE
jgi:hypothetical protein